MNLEELSNKLYEKTAGEQREYRDWLLKMTPEKVLEHAYEYSVREDILSLTDSLELEKAQIAALLESPNPLADVFNDFRNRETGYMDLLRECMEERADGMIQARRAAERKVPVYLHSGGFAREHGELEVFRASHRANLACKEELDRVIRASYDGMHLSSDAWKEALTEYGPERVAYILAVTLQEKDYDDRFSTQNREWAAAIPTFRQGNQRSSCVLETHPAILDEFVSMARKEMAQMAGKENQRRPSIRGQLAAKPARGEKSPAKPKDREAR